MLIIYNFGQANAEKTEKLDSEQSIFLAHSFFLPNFWLTYLFRLFVSKRYF